MWGWEEAAGAGWGSVAGAVLLRVPLLPLLPLLQLAEQRLPVGLVQLHDALQLLHEQQLQHPLVRVQVGQLEQLPLQDVVVPAGRAEGFSRLVLEQS